MKGNDRQQIVIPARSLRKLYTRVLGLQSYHKIKSEYERGNRDGHNHGIEVACRFIKELADEFDFPE